MYTYTTTSNSHPAHKKESSSSSYTTTSSSPYVYTTTSTSSQFTFTTTSTSSNISSNNEKYRFSVTSDYIKRKINSDDDNSDNDNSENDVSDNENKNLTSKRSTSSTTSKAKTKTKDCSICIETYRLNQFEKITNNCLHSNDICKNCVTRHIETQLNTKGDVEGILCPFGNDCGFLIEYNDVQRIVNGNLFERYDDLALKQTLSNMPDFRWCKNAGCGSGQIHSGNDTEPIMTCKACGQKSCYTHDIPWHDNLTCEQYNEAKKGEDVATQDLLDRETKKCPKCGVRITKNGGCNHMTCRVQSCKYEFCWLCLADFDRIRRHGNHYHERTCQLYG